MTGAVAAHGIHSISTLVVALIVARSLGPSALGEFAFMLTLLVAFVAVQTAWIGDSLTILDRRQAAIRDGLIDAQWMHVIVGGGAGGLIVFLVLSVAPVTALAFASLIVCWELQEFSRRVLMARLEFARLTLADASALATTSVTIALSSVSFGLTVTLVLVSMTAGCLLGCLVATLSVPHDERFRRPAFSGSGFRRVARLGFWRGAQGAASYSAQLATRALVIAVASSAVLGQLEAVRLVFAPIFTLAAATGNLTLATFARFGSAAGRDLGWHFLKRTTAAIGGLIALYGTGVLLYEREMLRLLVGPDFHSDPLVVLGWLLTASLVLLSAPLSSMALVLASPAYVFYGRLAGSLAGLGLTAGALFVSRPALVPGALGIGVGVSALLLGWKIGQLRRAESRYMEFDGGLSISASPRS